MSNIWILADASGSSDVVGMIEDTSQGQDVSNTIQDGSNPPTDGTPKTSPKAFDPLQIVIMVLIFGVMYMFLFRGPKKKQQEHQKMVSTLAKNDRVRTIGGIFGTVLDVRDDEIVLKIDESTNTKMRVTPGAIATVLKDKAEA